MRMMYTDIRFEMSTYMCAKESGISKVKNVKNKNGVNLRVSIKLIGTFFVFCVNDLVLYIS